MATATTSTLIEYLDSQQELENEAAIALPHSFSHCTFSLGYIRQAVYLCITCASRRGICSSCSIACHTDHEQLELFPKRRFRCDCPTSFLAHPCSLHKQPEIPNEENEYGQNFDSKFCRCGRPYNAKSERETMIQCLACEDWFHESCLNLRTRPSSRFPSPASFTEENSIAEVDQYDGSRSEVSSSGLPPPLITAEDYDALVCRSCVSQIPILQAWSGTPGVAMIVRESPDSSWKIIGALQEDEHAVEDSPEATPARVEASNSEQTRLPTQSLSGDAPVSPSNTDAFQGQKRNLLTSFADGPSAKRSRMSETPLHLHEMVCLAPAARPSVQAIFAQRGARVLGEGDVFLSGDWRKRWCLCDLCLPELRKHPYLLKEEETYEPPEDPDSKLSLEELGLRALERIPRDRALDGIRAFNNMRDDLKDFLRPFAQEGREVAEVDVRRFFETRAEAARIGTKR
ncbi:hypothetical protein B0F90DRAFT_1629706 [Multifurca ochricompacta]|uniref:UBR-type domain-containing protein n=1 Tax=Multifurca ochricompacta TaxID=376703 RepID=A0AAD4M3X1_9AGAM|nr:hypothetical protein B0F90DRAFT_1629706 [Multifurca ochricompacta]